MWKVTAVNEEKPLKYGLNLSPVPICLGIVAYQGVKTLDNTLASYNRVGLFDIVEATYILFQQIDSPERRAWAGDVVARYPSLRPMYEKTNTGFKSFMELLKACDTSQMVMILEEDFQVSDTMDVADVRRQFQNAAWLLQHGGVDAVRMRHRKNPGSPNWSHITWKTTGKISKTHLISHVFWDDHAEDHVPEITVCRPNPKTWCASSAHAHYTNNPTVYRREFAKQFYAAIPPDKQTFGAFEPWMTHYWSKQNYTVAYSDAVFTHNRLDRTLGTKKITEPLKGPPPFETPHTPQKSCQDIFVTGFWSMGPFRDKTEAYVDSATRIVSKFTAFGCAVHFFCGSANESQPNEACSLFKTAFANNPLVVNHALSLEQAMLDLSLDRNFSAEFVQTTIESMLNSWSALGRSPSSSDILKYPKQRMRDYIRINFAKFATLYFVANKLGPDKRCGRSSCIVWVDSGLNRHPRSTKDFDKSRKLSLVRSDTAVFSVSGTNWPTRDHTVFLWGPRHEVAAGIMTFDPTWFKTTFMPALRNKLKQLFERQEVTTEQGLLTLLVQDLEAHRLTLLTPSYDRIMMRMLMGG